MGAEHGNRVHLTLNPLVGSEMMSTGDLGYTVLAHHGPSHYAGIAPTVQLDLFLTPQGRRGCMHSTDNGMITGAAAQVSGECFTDFWLGGIWIPVEQRLGSQQHARRAETALHGPLSQECLLDRFEFSTRAR